MSDVIVKWKADFAWPSLFSIKRCEFVRETKEFFADGRRFYISSRFEQYFDTWAEAHAVLTEISKQRVLEARRALELANSYAGNVRGMKEPT